MSVFVRLLTLQSGLVFENGADKLRATADVVFRIDVPCMGFDSAFGDEQCSGDLTVGLA